MQEQVNRKKCLWIAAFFILLAALAMSSRPVQAAAADGWKQVGKYWYYYEDGKKATGWITDAGKKYYLDENGRMLTGMVKMENTRYYFDASGAMQTNAKVKVNKYYYYFGKNGKVVTNDWLKIDGKFYYANQNGALLINHRKIDGQYYYFDPDTAAMHTGWLKDGGYWYYFDKNGVRANSWQTIDGDRYYFRSGKMQVGWQKSGVGNYYYFSENKTEDFKEGEMVTGWLKYGGKTYFFKPSTGRMVKDCTATIGGKEFTFDKYGVLNGDGKYDPMEESQKSNLVQKPTSAKTVKNLMLNAMQPVGRTLYVWGGGWNDATRKGVNPTWENFYNSQPGSYTYYGVSDRSKGMDCSGYIGWVTYNTLHTASNQGSGYTVVSGEVPGSYKNRGWGITMSQGYLANNDYTLRVGDIGGDPNHVWMVVGQCEDKSVVIAHCTPHAGVQLAGTPRPDGNYSSQAVALAQKYMSKYPGYKKFDYHTSTSNYIRRGTYFRWNFAEGPISDPEGYRNMTADEILKDMFGE